jgi:putative DNA primase/helicase
MDGSPRYQESDGRQQPGGRAPVTALQPVNLAEWLHVQEIEKSSGANGNMVNDDWLRSEPNDRSSDHHVPPAQQRPAGSVARRPQAAVHDPILRDRPGNQRSSIFGRHAGPNDDRAARPAAYLAKIPPAIAGHRGHHQTFHAACVLVHGFDLTIDEARPLLLEWNNGCVPPWSVAELEHKLRDAQKAADKRPRGYLWDSGAPRAGRALRRDRPHGGADLKPSSTQSDLERGGSPSSQLARCPDGQEANPHRLAHQFLMTRFAFTGGVGIRYWREEYHSWDGTAYHVVPGSEMRAQLTRWLADEFERLYQLSLMDEDQPTQAVPGLNAGTGGDGRPRLTKGRSIPRPIPVTGRVVSDVLQALASLVLVSSRQVPFQPAWLPAWPSGVLAPADAQRPTAEPLWPPEEVLPARNALVHLPSLMNGASHVMKPCPRFFNAYALEYDFEPAPPVPCEWLAFLEQIWGTDIESIAALQEWFGYLLTPDTRHQKILMMVGPKRSGRGTIARVLKALVGSNTVVNPTLSTLARPFGLSTLIGKPIAIFPDARLSSRPDNAAIVECLLSISGEDDQTIDRKHMPAWTGKLSTRFVLISNELPRLRDVSGALAGRLIILRFIRSFYGQEDMALFERLRPELPGILRWAIAGWERLNRRGRFLQPRSAGELVVTMDELASPIAAFLRDRCIIEDDAACPVPAMYEAWRSWCQEHGRDAVGDEHSFGRDLHAAIPGLATTRPRTAMGRLRHYHGLRLRSAADPDSDGDRADSVL